MRGTLLRVDTPAGLRRQGRAGIGPGRARRRAPTAVVPDMLVRPAVRGGRASASDGALLVEVGDPRGDNPELVRALVEAGARIVGVHEESMTLEQVYLDMVGEAGVRDADGDGRGRIGEAVA